MSEPLQLLIVDDEKDFLEMLAQRLRLRGFKVLTVENCFEALRVLAVESVQVVVLDVMLPDIGGLECLQLIKKEFPRIGVVMLSGHACINAGMRGIECGASDYCLKPVEIGELVEKLRIAYAEVCDD